MVAGVASSWTPAVVIKQPLVTDVLITLNNATS